MSPITEPSRAKDGGGGIGRSPGDGAAARREVAVALQHDREGDKLPRVIASGEGAVARQILEIAFARGIKVREDADLAEVLAAVDVDSEIPLTALAAVAEILTYVYRASAGEPASAPTPENG